MIENALVDWSRAQFALTAGYHWIFVPLTLGLAVIMATMETLYVIKKDEFWKQTAKFWMKLFAINFAVVSLRASSLNLNSEPTGATIPGLWATSSVRRLPSRECWRSLWRQRSLPSCSSVGKR